MPNLKPRRDGYRLVCYGLNKQQETYCQVVRKSPLRLGKISLLVLIGPILNKIQPFKNLKINSPEKIILTARHHPDV